MTGNALPAQSTFVRQMGEGDRKVLALHCTISHSGAWGRLAAELQGQATLIAPDMLCHGQSPNWDGTGDAFNAVTEQALLQLTEPLDIIGHSFGGVVALRLAVEYPELIRSAVLIEPVFFAVALQDAPSLMQEHGHEAQPYRDALATGDYSMAARLFNRMWSSKDSPRWPDLSEKTRNAMVRAIHLITPVEAVMFEDTLGLLNPGVLDRASMPILLLRGSKTHPTISVINDGLQRRLPNSVDKAIEGAGHMVPISHPRETAEHVVEFWRTFT